MVTKLSLKIFPVALKHASKLTRKRWIVLGASFYMLRYTLEARSSIELTLAKRVAKRVYTMDLPRPNLLRICTPYINCYRITLVLDFKNINLKFLSNYYYPNKTVQFGYWVDSKLCNQFYRKGRCNSTFHYGFIHKTTGVSIYFIVYLKTCAQVQITLT